MLQIINNPKTIQSFSTLNAEKVSKLNNLILDSMTSFNTKYKEINDNLMELKLEFLNHINSVQSLLNGNDEEDISFNSDNLSLEKENFSPSSFKKNIGKNEEKNCLILKNDDKDIEEKFERNLERKKTFNQILRKDYKLSSILFNRDRRDDITKKNVTFHPEQVFKENTPGRKIKKKNKENKENKENKNLNENNKLIIIMKIIIIKKIIIKIKIIMKIIKMILIKKIIIMKIIIMKLIIMKIIKMKILIMKKIII